MDCHPHLFESKCPYANTLPAESPVVRAVSRTLHLEGHKRPLFYAFPAQKYTYIPDCKLHMHSPSSKTCDLPHILFLQILHIFHSHKYFQSSFRKFFLQLPEIPQTRFDFPDNFLLPPDSLAHMVQKQPHLRLKDIHINLVDLLPHMFEESVSLFLIVLFSKLHTSLTILCMVFIQSSLSSFQQWLYRYLLMFNREFLKNRQLSLFPF